ncbi:MAG: NCS2 family permease [Solobacterium sp.]|nr:NCS2 family permease [Solobacterium sp.]MCH4221968.1 NCS2 family permease [Solobacterium sp.]MCH4265573.1 NCS2 family permease [Solobacterium sp.]
MFERVFKLKEKHTTVRTELIAGLTTFLAMAYILAVNPIVLSNAGMDTNSVFLATALASGLTSILMGVLANYPVALSAGMGTNALFAYTVCGALGYTWEEALAVVLISGIIFVVISVTGIRKAIINAIPKNLKLAIGAGIGFFIAFIGLKNAGIVVASSGTIVSLGDFSSPQVLLAIIGIFITIALLSKKVPAGVFWGLLITAAIGLVMSFCGLTSTDPINNPLPSIANMNFAFNFSMPTLGACFTGFKTVFTHPDVLVVTFSFLFVDFFDTAGTLVAVGNDIGLVNENGEMENVEKALLADSCGTCIGAVLGTSTVTSFVESGSGVAAGGRTGLTACTTGVLFLLSVFLSPLLSVITSSVTTPALVTVGVLMAQQLKQIDWDDWNVSAPCFLTILIMILGYSISDGIAAGFLFYTVSMAFSGKIKEIKPIVYVLDIIFLIYFIF